MLLGRATVPSVIQKKRSEAHLSTPDRPRSSYIWVSPNHPTIWPDKLHPNTSKSTLVGSVLIPRLETSMHTNGPTIPYIPTTISGRLRQTRYRMRPWPARLWRALIEVGLWGASCQKTTLLLAPQPQLSMNRSTDCYHLGCNNLSPKAITQISSMCVMGVPGKPNHGTWKLSLFSSPHVMILTTLLVQHFPMVFNKISDPLHRTYSYDARAAAAATSQRYCSTVGSHNNPNSRRNGDISDDSIRDLDAGNFPRWAWVPCADRGTFRRFRSV